MEAFSGIYRGKKVLVTGHTGFKGAWLCEWLLKLGAKVAGYSLDQVSTPSLFEVNQLATRLKHFEGDIRDLKSLKSAMDSFQPEIVFHLAAQSLVRKSYDEPLSTFETNILGTVNLLEILRSTPTIKAGVFVTTDKCYENLGGETAFRETDALGGKDPYSASKAAMEMVVHSYHQSFFKNSSTHIASVRAGNVVGGGDWAVDRVIPDCMRAWAEQKPVSLRNPDYVRPWQNVLEPLSGYLAIGAELLTGNLNIVGEAFNLGPEIEHCKTVREVVTELNRHFKKAVPFEVAESDPQKTEAPLLRLNCDKAYEKLKWLPVLSFAETFSMTAEWYQAFYQGHSESIPVTQMQISEFEAIAQEKNLAWAAH